MLAYFTGLLQWTCGHFWLLTQSENCVWQLWSEKLIAITLGVLLPEKSIWSWYCILECQRTQMVTIHKEVIPLVARQPFGLFSIVVIVRMGCPVEQLYFGQAALFAHHLLFDIRIPIFKQVLCSPMNPMDCICWNSSVSVFCGSIQAMQCAAGHVDCCVLTNLYIQGTKTSQQLLLHPHPIVGWIAIE
jgi:hypothetical protein